MNPQPRRVLGIFAKRPDAGRVKTRLAAEIGERHATELYAAFLEDLVTQFADIAEERWIGYAPEAAADYFRELTAGRYRLWPQPAGDLGTRIEAFFDTALAITGTMAVLIGSDSPTLPLAYVEEAFRSLQSHDVVLGPATDGGYYLIGQRVTAPGWLSGVRWSGAETLSDTIACVDRQGWSLAQTPPFFDVDTAADLPQLIEHLHVLRREHPERPVRRTEAWLNEWVKQAR